MMPAPQSHRPPVDLRLYAVVDPEHAGGLSMPELARRVVAGGATIVQLRDKLRDTGVMIEEARAVHAVLEPLGIPFIVNDRVDVALAIGAEGVHVGQKDMAVRDVRRLMGKDAIVGLSIQNLAQAREAPVDLIDYAGIGGVFATSSKDLDHSPIGAVGLKAIADELRARAPGMPVCGISGITAANAAEVIAAGAGGVAVISALSLQKDPAAAARVLRGIVDLALEKRGIR
jgi:thiamine-phosphate pyrophosphorylase